jgi:superfamily II DNA/RNA helicase
MKFEEIKVDERIIKALREYDIVEPTPIQEMAIPIILQGKDIVGISKTGSGKTASFGIPIVQKIDVEKGLQALILTPTRELTVQIANELKKFSKYTKCEITTIFGGVAIEPQMRALKTAHIVVGTPGRILDHMERGTIDFSRLQMFTLDEADKMVEMGFIDDIRRIIDRTPDSRQVILFGATISREINDLKSIYMDNPELAKAEVHVENDFLEQYYYDIQPYEKFSLLFHLLHREETQRVIIFCSTRRTVELVAKNLRAHKVKCDMIHGKLSQNRRLSVIEKFNKGEEKVLVASAVAARGLDIKNVTHVFNFDLSRDPQEYIHRVGRTARAGEKGVAYTLLSGKDHDIFSAVLSRYPIKVEKLDVPKFEKLKFQTGGEQRQRRSFSARPREQRETQSRPGGRRWGEKKRY